jgi:16S rRNA (adenine1518-N6/adenine1519-N6)-dimethyltransferase
MLNIKAQLKKDHVFPKKSLGQHFLVDEDAISKIIEAAEVGPEDIVFEVGAGVGNMTAFLARRAKEVLAVEIDSRLVQIFKRNVPKDAPVKFFLEDVLRFDLEENFSEYGGGVKVVANLPYLISTPLIFRLIEHRHLFSSLTLMLQKEVAERLAAMPGSKAYGGLTVTVGLYADVEPVFELAPQLFYPQPKVASRIVRLNLLPAPRCAVLNAAVFRQIVKAAFGQRRKMLGNALKPLCGPASLDAAELLQETGIDPKRRGETLSIEEFSELANAFEECIRKT